MIFVIIRPSKKADKKYDAIINGTSTVSFGQKSASDFRQHGDEDRKQRYIKRHEKNEDWTDPMTAGFYSRWLLWNKSTLFESIEDVKRRFPNIKIKWSPAM